jgi:hypothetical protein
MTHEGSRLLRSVRSEQVASGAPRQLAVSSAQQCLEIMQTVADTEVGKPLGCVWKRFVLGYLITQARNRGAHSEGAYMCPECYAQILETNDAAKTETAGCTTQADALRHVLRVQSADPRR